MYATTHSLTNFNVATSSDIASQATITSLPASLGLLAFDGQTTTQYKSASTNNCYVQAKFPTGLVGRLEKIKFFMGKMTDKPTNFVNILKFQESSDGTTWTDVWTADMYLREGWNVIMPDEPTTSNYYRFFAATYKACQINEIQLIGNVVENTNATSKTCDVQVTISGSSAQTFSSAVTYTDAATPLVTDMSMRYGTYLGGDTLTITGTGFSGSTSTSHVTIDGIECTVTAATSTSVVCTTGARPTLVEDGETVLYFDDSTVNGYAAMDEYQFSYANYWSDLETWSGEYLPKDGDSIVIPKGQTLIVNIDKSPELYALIIYGKLVFVPEEDTTHHRYFDASYIFVQEGAVLEIGTEQNRYTSKLTITMHGTRESPQIPIYGNKGIFVRHGTLDLHGTERDHTWVDLGETVLPGGNQITLNTTVDWQVGEEIVIAPTDYEADHAEQFTIEAIETVDGASVITLDKNCQYKHYSGSVEYTGTNAYGTKTKTMTMRAEVALLSRSVVYKGADDDSAEAQYGAHIMLHSKGDESLIGRISYTEFFQVGQAFQLGRYPIHFHMIGTVHNSYIRGNAIHHTYNRACTLHGVHYLTLEKNVAFQTMGHTFFIEDAIETKNVLKDNLAIKTKASWSLLNTDQTPGSFWITNGDNMFLGNHAAGSDRYGFWFDLQPHPTGPSTDLTICPQYAELGEFTGNVAHSNGKYGLRIFHRMIPSDNPCAANDVVRGRGLQPDPVHINAIETHIRDFTGYKNKESGLIVEEIGAVRFHDIKIADSQLANVELTKTQAGPWLTSESESYTLNDALLIGFSDNGEAIQYDVEKYRGIKGSMHENMRAKDVLFVNFDYVSTWGAIGTCSHCEGPDTDSSGRTYFFKNLFFTNTTQKVKFDIPFKEIIYDEDGTLVNSTHRWVVRDFVHLEIPECERNLDMFDGFVCSDSIKIRRIVFHHANPGAATKNLPMKIMNMNLMPSARRSLQTTTCPTDDRTLNDLKSLEDDAVQNQLSLFAEYEPFYDVYHTWLDVRDARDACTGCNYVCAVNASLGISDYCSLTGSQVTSVNSGDTCTCEMPCNVYLCNEQTYNASLATILSYVDQRDLDYGSFDKLWTTDNKFCDDVHYARFDYRGKQNPTNNWVIPLATGYEYKIHIGQGADFTLHNGIYSYPELLNGESDGVVLHFNHTERAEAYNFAYTLSNGTTVTSTINNTGANDWLSMNSSVMGDMYLNNVTRHFALKLDGQDSDKTKFVLTRDECITDGGCNSNAVITDSVIETKERLWSNPASWETTRRVPVAGEDVVIDNTWNMVLDISETPILRSIEINGRLTIRNDGGNYTLHSYLIFVRKGEFIVGTEDEPFTGNAQIILYGDRASKDIYFNEHMFEGGNKAIAVTGTLRMFGQPVTRRWSRLASSITAGSRSLTLIDPPDDWQVGDELGIAPSGREYSQRDRCTITGISGNTITCSAAFSYNHYGAASLDSTKHGDIDIRAEVIHLSRNVKVIGNNVDRWGGQIVTGKADDVQFTGGVMMSVTLTGNTIIDNVEFFNCSQYDTDKAAVRFDNLKDLEDDVVRSKVTNSSFHDGQGMAIMVRNSQDVIVDGNVAFFFMIGAVWLKRSDNVTITNNVAIGLDTRWWSNETRLDELAAFNICNDNKNCTNLVIKNNIVGGFQRVGFLMPTVSCDDTTSLEGNMAHSVEHGAWVLDNNLLSDCEAFNNFKAYKTKEQGVLMYAFYQPTTYARNIETYDCGMGITIMNGGNNENTVINVENAVIWGESDLLPADDTNNCINIFGVFLSVSTIDGKNFPEPMLPHLPFYKIMSYATWFTEAYYTNVTFKNWKSGIRAQCSSASTNKQRVFFINPFSPDHNPVHDITDVVFDNVANDAVAYLDDPNPFWANIDDCGNWPCTGPSNVVIKLNNASSTGTNQPSITGLSSGIDFQIIANNPKVAQNMDNCTAVTSWNAYQCFNNKLAQLTFESLDLDKEKRMLSPIQYRGDPNNVNFNNTINTFMDHCWDGHYTCQKRLSRFNGMLQLNKNYEVWFSGTQPSVSRYLIQGTVDTSTWLQVKIDFSKSILYNVYADGNLIEGYTYNRTEGGVPAIKKAHCGENRFEVLTYTYEFYITKGCIVQLEAQDHLFGLVRLQMSIDEFFEDDFTNKLAYALGITTDKIKIVGAYEGSVVVNYYITSGESTTENRQSQLEELANMIATSYADGSLDLGAPILDLVTTLVNESGETVTSETGYSKKNIDTIVLALLGIALLGVTAGISLGVIKVVKTSKTYQEVMNVEYSNYEKGIEVSKFENEFKIHKENDLNLMSEEVKSI